MSDHADTIRHLLPLWHVGGTQGDRLLAELEAMEAERQQAQEEAARLKEERDNWKQSEFNERGRRLVAEWELQQAIDALREIAEYKRPGLPVAVWTQGVRKIAIAALVKLGEKP